MAIVRYWGIKTAQGRYWSEKMDEKALSAWLYGFIRNETPDPQTAVRVLMQCLCHLHNQHFDMYKPPPKPKFGPTPITKEIFLMDGHDDPMFPDDPECYKPFKKGGPEYDT